MSTFFTVPIDEYQLEDVAPVYERGDTLYDFRNPHFVSVGDFSEGTLHYFVTFLLIQMV